MRHITCDDLIFLLSIFEKKVYVFITVIFHLKLSDKEADRTIRIYVLIVGEDISEVVFLTLRFNWIVFQLKRVKLGMGKNGKEQYGQTRI